MGNMDVPLPRQPPPDVPAPPPGLQTHWSRKLMKGILWTGGVLVFLSAIAGLLAPPVDRRSPRPSDRFEAIISVKQLGLALLEFNSEYGQFPDASTIPAVMTKTRTSLVLGSSSSNDLFRQLLANGIKSEKVFWARSSFTPRHPDGVIAGSKALEQGECAFTYVAGLSSGGDPSTPLVLAPVIPGTWKFEHDPFEGKAIVLLLDGSIQQLPIDKNGDVILNGMNLFDPRQPYWHGKTPDIKWPE
jgi:hypothetical protein